MELAKLQALSVPLPIQIGADTFTIRYFPNRLTIGLQTSEGTIAEALSTVVEDLGLTDDGKPIELTAESLNAKLGQPVQVLIWSAILRDRRPNLTSPANSDAG